MANRELGVYTLMEHLGTGGMASVFRASDTTSSRIVALKIFEPNENRTPEYTRRLRDREVRMLVSVQHPNIVTFYDMGDDEQENRYYYAMEFVENSLLKRMRNGQELNVLEKIVVLRQTAAALVAMHHQGVVHRDIKPGNILLDQDPSGAVHVKITDLGIAKSVSETDIAREQMPTKVPGTAKYLPPEQIRLEPVDGRADIFSLGVTAYELLTGQTPFQAENSEDYLKANIEQTQRPLHELAPDVPEFISEVVDRMLEKDRENRYDSETLARDLQLVQQHLVSGAPLVERGNPFSLFYEGPDLDRREASGMIQITRDISPRAYVAAAAMVVAALVLGYLLWPSPPAGTSPKQPPAPPGVSAGPREHDQRPAPDGEQPAPASPSELLTQARNAVLDENLLYAYALVQRALDRDMPTEKRLQARSLRDELGGELALRSQKEAETLIEAGRLDEAEVLVDAMQEVLGEAARLEVVGRTIDQRRRELRQERAWHETVARADQLLEDGQFRQAVDEYADLLPMTRGHNDKRQTAREHIRQAIGAWLEHIRRADDAEAAGEFLSAHADSRVLQDYGPEDAVRAEMHLLVARSLQERLPERPDLYDRISRHYLAAARLGSTAQARTARQKMQALREWQQNRETAQMTADLKERGLASEHWQLQEEGEATAQRGDGLMTMRADGRAGPTRVEIVTPLPLKRAELLVSVKMRMDPNGAGEAGIELRGDENFYRFYYDSDDYRFKLPGVGAPIRGEFTGLTAAWHTLGLAYDPVDEEVRVLLDGKELRTNDVKLSRPRVAIYLEPHVNATAEVRLKDFTLEQE